MRKRVLVCGGRDFDDIDLIMSELSKLPRDCIIVTGDCPTGADKDAIVAARLLNRCKGFNFWTWTCAADWTGVDRSAGPRRNAEMLLEVTGVDEVIAFPGGRGTNDICERAQRQGIRVTRVGWDG